MQFNILLNYYNINTSNSQQFKKKKPEIINAIIIVGMPGFDNFLVNRSELIQLKIRVLKLSNAIITI